MEWRVGHWSAGGKRGKSEMREGREEGEVGGGGKGVGVGEWKEGVERNERDGKRECWCFRRNHFVMCESHFVRGAF